MSFTLLTPPVGEPLTLVEAKLHLRADDTADDTLIGILLTAARQWAEEHCARAFMTQTWRATLAAFPQTTVTEPDNIRLERAPVASVSSVQYVDANGATQLLAPAAYVVNVANLPPVIIGAYGTRWPTTRDLGDHGAAVTIDYVAGYGGAANVPAAIKAAILLVLGDLYANREAQIVGTITTENPTAKALLAPYRIVEAV